MKAVCKAAAVLVASLSFACTAFGQSEKSESPEKVDVQNLEKRYWAPKDKKFKVVQNRTYTKTKKVSLSLMPSLMLNEEYSKGFGIDASVGYYFTDRWGLELEYQSMSLDDNDLQNEVIGLGGFANHGKTTSYMGITGRWMPFYAKMSFLGTKIVYFDLSLGLSAGVMSYEQQVQKVDENGSPITSNAQTLNLDQTAVAFGFDVSQSFYMSRKVLLRVDYKHRFYSQDLIDGSDSPSTSGTSKGSRSEDSISLNLGVTVLF